MRGGFHDLLDERRMNDDGALEREEVAPESATPKPTVRVREQAAVLTEVRVQRRRERLEPGSQEQPSYQTSPAAYNIDETVNIALEALESGRERLLNGSLSVDRPNLEIILCLREFREGCAYVAPKSRLRVSKTGTGRDR